MNQQFRNIVYLSDTGGTGKWRRIWPLQSIDCLKQQTNIQADYSQTPILDPNYYNGINSVTVQRWLSQNQKNLFLKFLKPLCDKTQAWLIYEIDDAMHYDEIPMFNRGRAAYENDQVQQDIKDMLIQADLVTVTTSYIKNYYHKKYGVPLENIVALPNFLPKYLFGDRYNPEKKIKQFNNCKNKPRIGIISSLSHYNLENVKEDKDGNIYRPKKDEHNNFILNNGKLVYVDKNNNVVDDANLTLVKDDMSEINRLIRDTVNDFQWIFLGFCPPALQDLAKANKILVHGSVQIMNYPSTVDNLNLQAIVAPINDMEFNRCKSFIKYMEAAALGIPLYAAKSIPYTNVMDESQLYTDLGDLKNKLQKLKFMSAGSYSKLIQKQWQWLNSPCVEGDFHIKNFWLEDNLDIYINLFSLRQKVLNISLKHYIEIVEKNKQAEKENTIFETPSGMKIMKGSNGK